MNIRLYHPNSIVENTSKLLSKEHGHYVANVMRLKLGSRLNLFNKDGEWESEITFVKKDKVEVKFIKKIKQANNISKIELAICLVKKTPMDTILQKSTELGVSKIIPIVSERTEVKELNYDRAKKIVIEATEQSDQLNPPEISEVKKLKDFLNSLGGSTKLLFADVNSKNYLKNNDIIKGKSLSVLIGPEGDFSPAERESIMTVPDVKSFTLSKNILRSDTAVITAISLVNFVYFNS
ncbi:MAG: 16S rRNA (uracil(1498)-N(3))-methyltransferase [Pelagibacteraceae bacterium TMED246]|nr:MAG: 16S rRNA (uracil(1498)-N(3))-methyltransferase [Pelagibacteraceae bacterium TMED246]|tara:strand:- start:1666 stop:2376 length:711 start_codon:yes stop_codon:yes gene_type:complete